MSERDPIEAMKASVENREGEAPSNSELVKKFILHGEENRAKILDHLDKHFDDPDHTHTPESAARMIGLRRAFRNTHHALRKAKR